MLGLKFRERENINGRAEMKLKALFNNDLTLFITKKKFWKRI